MSKKPHISPGHVKEICALIGAWSGTNLTWEEIRAAAEPILGWKPSRSGLSAHEDIKFARWSRNKEKNKQPVERSPLPNSRAEAGRKIAAKDAAIAALELQRNALLDQFVLWQYNAALRGVTPQMLNDRSTEVVIDRVNVIGRPIGT